MISEPKGPGTGIRSGLSDTFAALRHYNYRLWFFGQMISLMGTWMQSTAQAYLIYKLTNSLAYLGLVGFMNGVPTWIFTLLGGVVADRTPRRRLMVITQTAMMVLAFILAILTFTRIVLPWHILVLAFLLGVANAFDAPARQSFVLELVRREDMTNAIAMNATMFNIGTVVGPAIAGLTYAAFGPGWCFSINGISFMAVIAALLFMHIPANEQPPRASSVIEEAKEGLRYVVSHSLTLSLTCAVGLVSIFGLGMLTLLPAWATDILHGDVTTNGWLVSARGVGSMISALILAYMGSRGYRGKLWTLGAFVMPVTLFIFAFLRWLPVSLLAMVGVGWGFMMIANNSNAIIQSHVPDQLRGRVMSVYTLIFFGAMPLGSLLAGSLAQQIGAPLTVKLSALFLLVLAVAAWLFLPSIRQQE